MVLDAFQERLDFCLIQNPARRIQADAVVRSKADHIVRLANEIGMGAQRGEEMVKKLAVRPQ